jgi:hypothetical protein
MLGFLAAAALGQSSSSSPSCATTLSHSYPTPSVAAGWEARLIATGFIPPLKVNPTGPRSLLFDSEGHLLLVSSGTGILNLELKDNGGLCVDIVKNTTLISSTVVGPSADFP